MSTLLGPDGRPIRSAVDYESSFTRPRTKPLVGELSAGWAGSPPSEFGLLTHQLRLQFDTSRLTLADFRIIREHYQINASLTVLTFLLHQASWRIEEGSTVANKHVDENMNSIWTRLMRAVGHSYWAGFSPNALQWENVDNRVMLTKIKDLPPEQCRVNWKTVTGKAIRKEGIPPPKVPIFDGIKQFGYPEIPVTNSFWYSLLREHGDYYGRRLLAPAVQPWYFSILMHLYANRYFERFAEPTPIGRAPFDDTVEVGGKHVRGNVLMASLLEMQRNGASIVLPNSRTPDSYRGESHYDYDIKYLESMMRGVDFERYMIRLDEEISLAIFTPLLMMRTSNVGSYNLGNVHTNLYLWILNALSADLEEYINRYLVRPMVVFNFGENEPMPKFRFRKMGIADKETLRSIVTAIIHNGKARPDIEELGQAIGLNLVDISELTEEPVDDDEDTDTGSSSKAGDGTRVDKRTGRPERNDPRARGTDKVKLVTNRMMDRVYQQAANAFEGGTFGGGWRPSLGYRRQFLDATADCGSVKGAMVYSDMDRAISSMAEVPPGTFANADEFIEAAGAVVEGLTEEALKP